MVVNSPMFTGEFEYRVDAKGRVPFPPKFRTEELKKEGVVLCPGGENCIAIYPLSEWKKLADSLTSGPIVPSKLRKINRAFFATAFNVEIDGQGRIMVPSQLRQYAGINEEVVVIGVNTSMELWGKEKWNEVKSTSQEEVWNIIETLERH
jgi:MraZ protein